MINRSAKLFAKPWWYLLVGDTLGLITLWLYWHEALQLQTSQFIATSLLLCIATALSAAPLIRFVIFDWEARRHEFLNRLNKESLIAYLQQFWEKRTTQDSAFICWHTDHADHIDGKMVDGVLVLVTQEQINKSMEKIFDAIYEEQHGRTAFIAPMILLNTVIFVLTVLCIFIYLNLVILNLDIHPAVAIASITGAYMYVVSDSIQCVRQRSLNTSNLYWYVLRMLLAIPIGIALTAPIIQDLKPFVAFGVGALPMDQIIKLLRQLASKQLNVSNPAEESDQLIKLEGVTVRIASILVSEGIDSIEQIITVDPVLLSIRTGLPFKYILQLGAQAIVRRHLGATAEQLVPLGLADARSISALIADLDSSDLVIQSRAKSALVSATAQITAATSDGSTIVTSTYTTDSLEFSFRQVINENYSRFILGNLLDIS
jgi:hypothetical protein